MKVEADVIEVLKGVETVGNMLRITQKLDRTMYQKVNKTLTGLGGKWSSKEKAHVFEKDVSEIIGQIIETGEYKDLKADFQFFPTPPELAKKVVEMAEIKDGENCLEPSAGRGGIAQFMPNCDCIELNQDNAAYLREHGFNVIHDDFMTFKPKKDYAVIVMNPPFNKGQAVAHVTKAILIAKRCVIAITDAGIMFRTDKATTAFRELVKSYGGTIEPLEAGAFKESGTMVNTVIITVRKL